MVRPGLVLVLAMPVAVTYQERTEKDERCLLAGYRKDGLYVELDAHERVVANHKHDSQGPATATRSTCIWAGHDVSAQKHACPHPPRHCLQHPSSNCQQGCLRVCVPSRGVQLTSRAADAHSSLPHLAVQVRSTAFHVDTVTKVAGINSLRLVSYIEHVLCLHMDSSIALLQCRLVAEARWLAAATSSQRRMRLDMLLVDGGDLPSYGLELLVFASDADLFAHVQRASTYSELFSGAQPCHLFVMHICTVGFPACYGLYPKCFPENVTVVHAQIASDVRSATIQARSYDGAEVTNTTVSLLAQPGEFAFTFGR